MAGATGSGFGRQWRWLSWVLAAIVTCAALVIGVTDNEAHQSQAEEVQAIARTIRCPQCRGQSVAESDVEVARQIRADIARRVAEGQTEDEIKAAFVEQFDDPAIVLTPPASGLSASVWIVPMVAGVLGAVALVFALARWRRESLDGADVTDEDRALVDRAVGQGRR